MQRIACIQTESVKRFYNNSFTIQVSLTPYEIIMFKIIKINRIKITDQIFNTLSIYIYIYIYIYQHV